MSLGVVVTAIKRQVSKRSGAEFARLTVEDFSGSSEVLIFPEAWGLLADRVKTDVPVLLKGGYSRRDQGGENPTFIVEALTPFVELRLTGQVAVSIDLTGGDALMPDVMRDVRAVIESHGGSPAAPAVELRWSEGRGRGGGSATKRGPVPIPVGNGGGSSGGETRVRLRSRSLRLAATQAALADLRALLGAERVRLVRGS